MNNRIFKTLGLLTLLITFSGLVSATTFNQPAATPPTGNIVPLHTGSSQQKTGSFSVNTLLARGIATFNQQVYINNVSPGTGVLRGSGIVGSDNEKVVAFGGIVEGSDPNSTDDDEAYNTSLVGSGRITAEKFLRAGKIAHDATIAEKRSLCADSEGRVVFCQQATSQVDVCANIEGIQTNPPTGMVRSGNNCVWNLAAGVILLGSTDFRTTSEVYTAIGGSGNTMNYLFNSNYWPDNQLTSITGNASQQEDFIMTQAVCRGVGPNISGYPITLGAITFSSRSYATNYPDKPFASVGDIIYEGPTTSTPFNGGGNWRALSYNGIFYAVKINSTGVIQSSLKCL